MALPISAGAVKELRKTERMMGIKNSLRCSCFLMLNKNPNGYFQVFSLIQISKIRQYAQKCKYKLS
jgi:hypothetical protein